MTSLIVNNIISPCQDTEQSHLENSPWTIRLWQIPNEQFPTRTILCRDRPKSKPPETGVGVGCLSDLGPTFGWSDSAWNRRHFFCAGSVCFWPTLEQPNNRLFNWCKFNAFSKAQLPSHTEQNAKPEGYCPYLSEWTCSCKSSVISQYIVCTF